MPRPHPLSQVLLAIAALHAPLGRLVAQDSVQLPHATGSLAPPADWTVLRGDAMAAATRPTDPADEPARAVLQAMAHHLHQQGRTADHVLLHQPGAQKGQLRTINAYSAEVAATASALQTDRAMDQMKRALEEALAGPDTKVVYTGGAKWEAFAVGGVTLEFELTVGDRTFVDRVHVVPAGDRLQYFEAQYEKGDDLAPLAVARVLATFDGAHEKATGLPWPMILGGIGGAIAGVLAGRMRNRRRAAAAAAAGDGSGS